MGIVLAFIYLITTFVLGFHIFMYVYLPNKDRIDGHLVFGVILLTCLNIMVAALQLMSGTLLLPNGLDGYLLFSSVVSAIRLCIGVWGMIRLYGKNWIIGR